MAAGTDPNLELLEDAALKLGELLEELVLVGGCAAGLLVNEPGVSPIRATEDVDLVVEAASYVEYHRFGQRLKERGFRPAVGPGDPVCRFRNAELVVDVMPLDEQVLGFSNRWYAAALVCSKAFVLPSGREIKHIDAPHFLATKLEAFASRGQGDHALSEDLEDIVIVVDGRAQIEEELEASATDLRECVRTGISGLLEDRLFREAMPGYFLGEANLDRRMRELLRRLRTIAIGSPT